jgi:hypothetical protein
MNFALTNAFPVTPMQDKFGQIVFPMAGLSKLEYYALELYKTYCTIAGDHLGDMEATKIMATAIHDAIDLLKLLEEKTKNLQNEKTDNLAIIQS